MKKVLMIALALLTLGSQMEVAAEKKEKKAKEKKALKWEWDGKTLSGNETIDTYIKTIDTLYNKVQSYAKNMSQYEMVTRIVEDKTTGKKYEMAYMLDDQGNLVTRGTVNWQCVEAVMQGTNIVLDMTNAGLMSANAALTLPQLGLNALKFGKYVKGGPAVISAGVKAIKDVRAVWLSNSRTWKDMKVDAVADVKSLNLEGMTDELAEKLNKCIYIREVKESSETTNQSTTVELNKEVVVDTAVENPAANPTEDIKDVLAELREKKVAEEDKNKTRNEMGDMQKYIDAANKGEEA